MALKNFVTLFAGLAIFCLSMPMRINTAAAQSRNAPVAEGLFSEAKILMDQEGVFPREIRFPEGKGMPASSFFENYKKAFRLSDDNEIKPIKIFTDQLGQTHHRYKQYYRGVELAEVHFLMHEKDGLVFYAHGPLIHGLDLNVRPALTEAEALQRALARIGAESYMWQHKAQESHLKREQNNSEATYYPRGELRLSAGLQKRIAANFRLVYRFDIYAAKPLGRYDVDVDAKTGEVINVLSRTHTGDVAGRGMSFYNGSVPITVNDSLTSVVTGPSHWHLNSKNAFGGSGESWWAADPNIPGQGGYDNHWYEVLDTDAITLTGENPRLTFHHHYAVETPGGEPAGYDGWDGMNVRISTATDTVWRVLRNPTPAYTASSLYSFGVEFAEGPGVPGWAGRLNIWTQVSFDLSAYAGQTVRLRFAFCSDPALSTADGEFELFGWRVDDILVESSAGVLYSNNGVAAQIAPGNIAREATFIPGKYRLREAGRRITTYDARNGEALVNAVDFVDADSNFTDARAAVGVSAHWAAAGTYDYFFTKHARYSFDDAGGRIISYVHFGDNFDNASWDGIRMIFGDGPNNSIPNVANDIVAHEFTHGVTQYSANLIYAQESGALNESFSDIFGEAVEVYLEGAPDWLEGADAAPIRSFSNPNDFQQPDTYLGDFWLPVSDPFDNGGVHINSGVQNHWFYLLTEGGSGVNDNNDAYAVNGIGMEQAAQIAYRNLTVYLTPTSQYADARLGSLNSAVDLFGAASPQAQAVKDAWHAVGVLRPFLEPTVSISVDTLHFLAEAAVAADTAELVITNFGLENLRIDAIQIPAGAFQIMALPPLPVELEYEEELSLRVVFSPAAAGVSTAALNISSNDPAQPGKTVHLNGRGYVVHPAGDATIYSVTGRSAGGVLLILDPLTGNGNTVGATSFEELTGVSIRPSNSELYATIADNAKTRLLRIDAQTGEAFESATIAVPQLRAIAFDRNDNLYAARFTNGALYRIDPATAQATLIGSTGLNLLSGLAINPVDDALWGVNTGNSVYQINKTTAQATLVGNTGFNRVAEIAFDATGKLLGLNGFASNVVNELVQINPATGKGTLIGSTNFRTVYGLAIRGVITTAVQERPDEALPARFALHPNYPNPFNPSTAISFDLPRAGEVELAIFNSAGQLIRRLASEKMSAGRHVVVWDAKDEKGLTVASGVYVSILKAGDFTAQRKLVLMK